MSNEELFDRVPPEGANAELNDGELLGGVLDFEVPNVVAVKLEGLSPGGAGNPGHFQVDGNEVGGPDEDAQIFKRRVEVGSCDILESEGRSAKSAGEEGGAGVRR